MKAAFKISAFRKYLKTLTLKRETMKTGLLLSICLLCLVLTMNGQWTYDSLTQPRNWMGAVSFGITGYFAGGETDLGDASIVETYDLINGLGSIGNLSVPRSTLSAVACDSMLFFAGGFTNITSEAYSTVDIWNLRTQQWTVAELTIPRFALSAVSKGNEVLFAGGLLYDLNCYDQVDIYNTLTGNWGTDNLSLARGAMASAVVGDLAIFAGGLRQGGNVTNVVDIYNFNTGAWTTAHLSQARFSADAVTLGNKVLIAGGMLGDFMTPSDRVDIYDAETDTWTTASLSSPRTSCGAAVINGKAYFAGGGTFGSGAVLSDFSWVIDIYDPESDSWSVDYLNQPVASQSVLGISNHLIVAGGKTVGDIRVKTIQIFYDPQPDTGPNQDNTSSIKIYPNPSSGNIHLEFSSETIKNHLLTDIYNLQGQKVFNQTMEPGNQELNLNLPAGVYLLKVSSGEFKQQKLITISAGVGAK